MGHDVSDFNEDLSDKVNEVGMNLWLIDERERRGNHLGLGTPCRGKAREKRDIKYKGNKLKRDNERAGANRKKKKTQGLEDPVGRGRREWVSEWISGLRRRATSSSVDCLCYSDDLKALVMWWAALVSPLPFFPTLPLCVSLCVCVSLPVHFSSPVPFAFFLPALSLTSPSHFGESHRQCLSMNISHAVMCKNRRAAAIKSSRLERNKYSSRER